MKRLFNSKSTKSRLKPAIRRPEEAKALEMFAALHGNIYDAFEYKTESDIYDVLAEQPPEQTLDNGR